MSVPSQWLRRANVLVQPRAKGREFLLQWEASREEKAGKSKTLSCANRRVHGHLKAVNSFEINFKKIQIYLLSLRTEVFYTAVPYVRKLVFLRALGV